MIKRVIPSLLLLCLLLTACQVAKPTAPSTSGGSLETPTAGTTAPTTLPTQTTVLPTTLPTPPATEPPQINNTVTPVLTEPFDILNVLGNFAYIELRTHEEIMELAQDVEIGQTVVDSLLAYTLEQYDSGIYLAATVCYSAMLTGNEQEDAALGEQIRQRFQDAGYYTESTFRAYAQFTVYATKQQILEMFCGDDLAVFISSAP